jgi:hypothetical protein
MDRRMAGEHRMTARSAQAPGRGATRGPAGGRSGWRPDLALWVAIGGLVLGILVMIPLLRAVAPSPPNVFAPPAQSSPAPLVGPRPAPTAVHSPLSTFRSGGSVVARGVAYTALSAQRTTSLELPGGAGAVTGNLVIVKLQLRGQTATPSTASVGLVDLIDGGVDYRPLLPVASALAHTRFQALVLKQLAAGATKRVKLVFEVPNAVPVRLKLLIGSHAAGARRFPIPVRTTG